MEYNAIWHCFELTHPTPNGHQKEETQINHGADLRHQIKDIGWRFRAQITQNHKVDKENTVQRFVPAWTIPNRTHGAVV
jgi:hypothetical protein